MKASKIALLFGFLFILISCHKDDIDVRIVEEENPVKIDYPVVQGTIYNQEGKVVNGAKIDIYQKGVLVGSTASDSLGKYSTHKTKLKFNSKVTINAEKEGLEPYFRRTDKITKDELLDLSLVERGKTSFPSSPLNPADTSLVKIYGSVLTESGKAGSAFIFITYDDATSPSGFKLVATHTRINGQYEIYAPVGKKVSFNAFGGGCARKPLYPNDDLGIVTEDIEIPNLIVKETDQTYVKRIKGKLTCSREEGIVSTDPNYISISINHPRRKYLGYSTIFTLDESGEFDITNSELCYDTLDITIGFSGTTVLSKKYLTDDLIDLGTIDVCESYFIKRGKTTFSAEVDGRVKKGLINTTMEIKNDTTYDFHFSSVGGFYINNPKLGTDNKLGLFEFSRRIRNNTYQLRSADQEFISSDKVSMNITELTDTTFKATMKFKAKSTTNNQVANFTCDINIE